MFYSISSNADRMHCYDVRTYEYIYSKFLLICHNLFLKNIVD